MAIAARLDTRGCIHHSDRGVQYASDDYIDILRTHGFQISMSAKGNPGDNAFVESFFKTLKYEEIPSLELRDLRGRDRTCPILHRGGLQSQAAALLNRLSSRRSSSSSS